MKDNENLIYLDYAATAPVKPEVIDAMLPYFNSLWQNPSSIYSGSLKVKNHINNARKIIANSINANPEEIYFTSGGSESDNWSLKGITDYYNIKHIVTTQIEHPAIYNTCKYLETKGITVTYLPVDKFGFISLDDLRNDLKNNEKTLVSIMFANNEIGTIQFVEDISRITHEFDGIFHTDAVQAFGQVDIDVKNLGIDLMSVSGHKIGTPKGVGFLYKKNDINISPLIHGGKQENNLRAGTENVPYIIGLSKAVELISQEDKEDLIQLRTYLMQKIRDEIPDVIFNGSILHRLPNNISVSFKGIDAESLLSLLDMQEICVSSGSACSSGALEPSRILKAIGLSNDYINGTIRISIGNGITREQIYKFVLALRDIVSVLRNMNKEVKDD